MSTKQGILTLAVALAIAGCASSNMNQSDTTGMSTNYPSDTSGKPDNYASLPDNPQVGSVGKASELGGHITSADRAFIRDVQACNQFEISAAQKVLAKSSDQQLKDVAQRISDDHVKANDQLTSLAQRKGVPDTGSMDLNPDQLKQLAKLDGLSGGDFEREYLSEQIEGHRETVDKFKTAAQGADDKDLRDWASATLPTLQNHLNMLQDQSRRIGSGETTPKVNDTPTTPTGLPSEKNVPTPIPVPKEGM